MKASTPKPDFGLSQLAAEMLTRSEQGERSEQSRSSFGC